MAEFIVEQPVEVYSPKECNFTVETTIKFRLETTMENCILEDRKFGIGMTIKIKVESTEQKLKKELLVTSWIFSFRSPKIEERLPKVNVVEVEKEEGCENEGREFWRGSFSLSTHWKILTFWEVVSVLLLLKLKLRRGFDFSTQLLPNVSQNLLRRKQLVSIWSLLQLSFDIYLEEIYITQK